MTKPGIALGVANTLLATKSTTIAIERNHEEEMQPETKELRDHLLRLSMLIKDNPEAVEELKQSMICMTTIFNKGADALEVLKAENQMLRCMYPKAAPS